jgi:hypothetical protein
MGMPRNVVTMLHRRPRQGSAIDPRRTSSKSETRDSPQNPRSVAFRSAKVRAFAERKTTIPASSRETVAWGMFVWRGMATCVLPLKADLATSPRRSSSRILVGRSVMATHVDSLRE